MITTPELARTSAQTVATLHIATPRWKIREVMGPGIAEVMDAVKAQRIGPTGPWFAHHLNFAPDTFDFDICVPVSSPVTAVARVLPGERPALTVVRTVYAGGYEGLADAWREFMQWISAQGHRTAGDVYECYLVGPEASPDPAHWRTELSCPLLPG